MRNLLVTTIWGTVLTYSLTVQPITSREFVKKPKLVIFLIFDQLRADLLTRYYAEHSSQNGGFKQIIENGAWFPSAEYMLLQNMTGPGHATLLSGSYPYRSGIPLNEWYDTDKKSAVYCAQDNNYRWFSGEKKREVGTSPANLIGSNLPDEFKSAYPKSRVVSLSLKDRAAILMGGHRADLAVWMDPGKFLWTSTEFYFPESKLSPWIEKENNNLGQLKDELVKSLNGAVKALLPPEFPQGLYWRDKSAMASPAGLEITERLALGAIDELSLGKKEATDFLLVSFSSHDYAGHSFGPQSDAIQAMLKAEDQMLARVLSHLKKSQNGNLNDVLIVLSSDHGVGPNPEWATRNRLNAGRLDESELTKNIEREFSEKYGKTDGGWVLKTKEVNVYLNKAAASKKNIPFAEMQSFAKTVMLKEPTIAQAFTENEVATRQLPPGILERQILNSYFPGRSGHVVGILKPFNISSASMATHETGYSYDRTVPLVLMGRNIKPGVYSTTAEISDIAPTVAHLLGTLPPSNSHGRVLHEVIRR